MSQHTPGPWATDMEGLDNGDDIPINASGVYIATVTTCWPCVMDLDGELQEEGKANARLIAAAPDLLAACKEMLLRIKEYQDLDGLLTAKERGSRDKMIAAVAKAEGGAPCA